MSEADARNASGQQKRQPSNLQLRVMSAVVLIVAVLALAWFGGLAFRIFAAVLGAAVFYEWSTLARGHHSRVLEAAAWLLFTGVLIALVAGVDALSVFGAIVVAAAGTAVLALISGRGIGLAAGVAYAALPAAALAFLRGDGTAGLWVLLFLFATVWATDIAAYFAGRAIGGPKLAPSISPSKTWSGAIGGAVAGAVCGAIVAALGPASIGLAVAALIAAAVSIVSQFGDLFESAYKRRHNAKDSGRIIPGHGGVMDRVDGLVAGAVALYLLGAVLGGWDNPAAGLFQG